MLSALIAPFKYMSPAANGTEDEDTLSQYALSHSFELNFNLHNLQPYIGTLKVVLEELKRVSTEKHFSPFTHNLGLHPCVEVYFHR